VLTGGDGDNRVFGGGGDDRMVWNPGDDTNLNEGGLAADTTEINGGGGPRLARLFGELCRKQLGVSRWTPSSKSARTAASVLGAPRGRRRSLRCVNLQAVHASMV